MGSTDQILAAGLLPPYTMEEVEAMLGCEAETVVALIQSGDLAATKPGRSWIFPRVAFHESLNRKAMSEAIARAAEREARGKAVTVIAKAKKPPRRREPPTLPPLP
jgi:excisionase family DNA binding protein